MKNRYTEIMAGEETLRQSLASAPDRRPLARRVFFKPDCHEVQEEFLPLIHAHAEYLRENPDRFAVVSGHTWGKGTESYCRQMGERRSRSVAHALVGAGARLSQIVGLSKGSATPVVNRGSKAPEYLRRANIEYCSAEELAAKLVPKSGASTWWKASLGKGAATPGLQTA